VSPEPSVEAIQSPLLKGVPHGFLTRTGGVSTGLYASLNCRLGSGDNPESVAENRRRAVDALLPGAGLATLHQIHSARVVVATGPIPNGERPEADALVTDCPGLLLGVLTADCTPVLFADTAVGVVGAAHAGWKGALSGVTDATLDAMEALGADRSRIVAAIGPVIARASYEVDDAFGHRFAQADPANDRFFTPGRSGHHQFDLEAYVAARLAAAGVTRVHMPGLDTYSDPARFFSYRRATHRGEAEYGCQLSLIGVGR
jgi:polyphenol oxidase